MAGRVDALYFFLVGVSAFFSILIAGLIFYFAVRYRRTHHAEYPRAVFGLVKLEIIWSVIPLILTMIMFAWGAVLYFQMHGPPPGGNMRLYVVGKQWMWKVQHPTGHVEINELHVPVGRPVQLTMVSEDVIHSFYIPAFRVKMDVLPGRYTSLWFEATKTGEYHLFCAEYCGTKHSEMIGRVVVLSPRDYQQWLQERQDVQPLVHRGEAAFQQYGCTSCHGQQEDRTGPSLRGRFGKPVQLADGRTVPFDEHHIRQSVYFPKARITAGFADRMPTFAGQVDETEMVAIIEYLKSLSAEEVQAEVAVEVEEDVSQYEPDA